MSTEKMLAKESFFSGWDEEKCSINTILDFFSLLGTSDSSVKNWIDDHNKAYETLIEFLREDNTIFMNHQKEY